VWELRPGSFANPENKLGRLGSEARAALLPVIRRHNRTLTKHPNFPLFPWFCALFFPLVAIVLAPAAFLPLAQGLAL
jgi:hypothetical protein